MKSKIFIFLLVLLYQFSLAQDIIFKSQNTNEPLNNVTVFGTSGKVLATSDISGKINQKELLPWQEKYSLVYDNYQIAELNQTDFTKGSVLLNDKITTIAPIILNDNSKAKYVFIKCNFNQYNTTDKNLNQYLDGELTFVFDNKSKKLKKTILYQYRLFEKPNSNNQTLKLPDMAKIYKLSDEQYRAKNKMTQTEIAGKNYLQSYVGMFTKKEFKLFGVQMKNLGVFSTYIYRKGSLDLNHFKEFNQKTQIEAKKKSMADFLQYESYSNFYVIEKSYGDEISLDGVDLEDSASHFKTEFWKEADFPNLLPTLNNILKNNLKPVENKN